MCVYIVRVQTNNTQKLEKEQIKTSFLFDQKTITISNCTNCKYNYCNMSFY